MVIDLLEKGQVNIKDLTLPGPESKHDLPFDPERDLTEEDWELLKRNLELCSDQDSGEKKQHLPAFAKEASLLFPNRVKEVMPLLAKIWEGKKQELTDGQSIERLSDMKLIFPAQFRERDIERYWDTLKERYDDIVRRSSRDPETILHYAAWMKILYPEKSDQITPNSSSLREIQDDLGSDPFLHAIHIAARLRLVSEEAFSNIKIDKNDWQSIKSELNGLRSQAHQKQNISSAYQFFNAALNMKILAEPSVRITQNGLEFERPVKLQPATPSIPERRAF